MAMLKEIQLVSPGKYLNKYELTYETAHGGQKIYELVSHNPALTSDAIGREETAVVLLVFDQSHEHILLGREFRMGVNCYVMNNIAGFIDAGEITEQAAARELKEETGLKLTKVLDVLPSSFTCAPVTDMTTTLVVCEAEGTLADSDDPNEEVQPMWLDRESVESMLRDPACKFAGRAQAFAYMWVNGAFAQIET